MNGSMIRSDCSLDFGISLMQYIRTTITLSLRSWLQKSEYITPLTMLINTEVQGLS